MRKCMLLGLFVPFLSPLPCGVCFLRSFDDFPAIEAQGIPVHSVSRAAAKTSLPRFSPRLTQQDLSNQMIGFSSHLSVSTLARKRRSLLLVKPRHNSNRRWCNSSTSPKNITLVSDLLSFANNGFPFSD